MEGFLRVAAAVLPSGSSNQDDFEDRLCGLMRRASEEGAQVLAVSGIGKPAAETLLRASAQFPLAVCTTLGLPGEDQSAVCCVQGRMTAENGVLLESDGSRWALVPPADAAGDAAGVVTAVLQGALLCCCAMTGDALPAAMSPAFSAMLRAAFVCVSCTEARIMEAGETLASSDTWCVADIDMELLGHARTADSMFEDCRRYLAASALEARVRQDDRPADAFLQRMEKPFRTLTVSLPPAPEGPLRRVIPTSPFVPDASRADALCAEVYAMQVQALARRLQQINPVKVIVGVSGGLDSTLALLVMTGAMDYLNWSHLRMMGVTMPGFGTTSRTYRNAVDMIKALGADFREISIRDACLQHFSDIGQDASVHDVTYENAQARERTQILMDLANKEEGLVIGTGDLSELALGWATYNGDHMSMYGVNADIPKTLVRLLVRWVADHAADPAVKPCLYDVLDTPVSPELLPADNAGQIAQKTEDLVGPYELHDFFLFHMIHNGFAPEKIFRMACQAFEGTYGRDVILKWLRTFCRRFFNQQYKRSCSPDGPKVLPAGLSPRGEWCMPSDALAAAWTEQLGHLKA